MTLQVKNTGIVHNAELSSFEYLGRSYVLSYVSEVVTDTQSYSLGTVSCETIESIAGIETSSKSPSKQEIMHSWYHVLPTTVLVAKHHAKSSN